MYFDVYEADALIYGYEEFITEKAQLSQSTLARYKIIIEHYLYNVAVNQIPRGDFQSLFNENNLARITRRTNVVRPALLRFLDFLKEDNFINDNYIFLSCQEIIKSYFSSPHEHEEQQRDFLTPQEIKHLFSERMVYKNDNERKLARVICTLSFFCMFKQGEVIRLRIYDYDRENKRLRNIRKDENSDLVEWINLNQFTVGVLDEYLEYRGTQTECSSDELVIFDNVPLDNAKISNILNCYRRNDNRVFLNDKSINQELLMRSYILYLLLATKGQGVYSILSYQDKNTAFDYAFNEYLSVYRAKNNDEEVSNPFSFEDILPEKTQFKEKRQMEIGIYSEKNDINEEDLIMFDSQNNQNLKAEKVTIQRMVRDSSIARTLKESYNHTCQLCGFRIRKSNGEYSSEAHHIKPYNRIHCGDDNFQNLIVLCANCHTQFDDLYFAIDPNSLEVHCIFEDDEPYHKNTLVFIEGHKLDRKYLDYTWKLCKRLISQCMETSLSL
ncbi:HNH endonuclease [Ammoniphilus sp. 3BR4]|uniref:HNH endonuclease n=1 Tax=Ammoniphilus sp. 3BR4 TaxID=3158265 RepID=UPI00346502B0